MKSLLGLMLVLCATAANGQTIYRCPGEIFTTDIAEALAKGCDQLGASRPPPGWRAVAWNAKTQTFIKEDSLRVEGRLRRIWLMWAYAKPPDSSPNAMSALEHNTIDCQAGTMSSTQRVEYAGLFGGGDVVRTFAMSLKDVVSQRVVPGSMGEATLEAVCAMKR